MKHHKRTLLFVFLNLAAIFGLTACGHNAVVFGKGFGLRAGFDPEHMSADVSFIYGEQLTLAARDNIKIKLKTGVEGGQESAQASTSADSMLEIEIGQQVNGYFCDAVKAGADAKDLIAINGNYPPADAKPAEDEVKAAEEPAATPEPAAE